LVEIAIILAIQDEFGFLGALSDLCIVKRFDFLRELRDLCGLRSCCLGELCDLGGEWFRV
jgi:hypothetical protein